MRFDHKTLALLLSMGMTVSTLTACTAGGTDAGMDLRTGTLQRPFQVRILVLVADHRMLHAEFPGLGSQQGGAVVGSNQCHLKTVRMLPDHIQRLATDRPRRSQDGYPFLFHRQKLI